MASFKAPTMPETESDPETIEVPREKQVLSYPTHQGELMGTPRIFGLRNQNDFSANAFLKANKRCWSLNPSFFINDELKIAYLSTRLAGPAEIWFSSLEDRDDSALSNLASFSEKFLQEFATTRTDWQIRVDLHTHRQGKRSISEYTASFISLSNQCNYGDKALLTAYFLGLNSHVQTYLETLQFMPGSFNDIVASCLDYGSRRTIIPRPSFPSSRNHVAISSGLPSQPMEIDVVNTRQFAPGPRPQLSPEEKENRIKNNLCLYCGSGHHFVTNCPLKSTKNL